MSPQISADAILADSIVVQEIRRAFNESNVGGEHPVEQGGFILQNADGTLSAARLPASEPDSLAFPICPDGTYQNRRIVGSFHTHPNTGPEWQQEPSDQDILVSIDYPETVGPHQFVVGRDAVYHIDNEGCVTEIGATSQILQILPGNSA